MRHQLCERVKEWRQWDKWLCLFQHADAMNGVGGYCVFIHTYAFILFFPINILIKKSVMICKCGNTLQTTNLEHLNLYWFWFIMFVSLKLYVISDSVTWFEFFTFTYFHFHHHDNHKRVSMCFSCCKIEILFGFYIISRILTVDISLFSFSLSW